MFHSNSSVTLAILVMKQVSKNKFEHNINCSENDVTFKTFQKIEDDRDISLQSVTMNHKIITIFEYPKKNDK